MALLAPPLVADLPIDPAAVGVSAGVVAFLLLGPVIRRAETEGASSDYRETTLWDVAVGRLVSYCLGAAGDGDGDEVDDEAQSSGGDDDEAI